MQDGVSGLLVPERDDEALTGQSTYDRQRAEMPEISRQPSIIEEEFDREKLGGASSTIGRAATPV
jgi:hypothetical protein